MKVLPLSLKIPGSSNFVTYLAHSQNNQTDLARKVWFAGVLPPGSDASPCLETGDAVLKDFGFTLPTYAMVLAMLGFLVVLHVISFLSLSNLHRSNI